MSPWAWIAAATTSSAVLVGWPDRTALLRHRLGAVGPPEGARLLRLPGPLVVVVGGLVALYADGARAIVVAVIVGVTLFVVRGLRTARHRVQVHERRAEVAGVLDLLAGELRAGILPQDAVLAVAADAPVLDGVAIAARCGGDIVASLRAGAARDGAEALHDLAAAWQVAERAGAPLSVVLDRVAVGLRDELETEREAAAEAAPARATGRLMAGLPVLGLGLGAGLGADPLQVLTETVPGALCLAVGATLACAGSWWVDRIADSVASGRTTP